jgi:hypothetical protein
MNIRRVSALVESFERIKRATKEVTQKPSFLLDSNSLSTLFPLTSEETKSATDFLKDGVLVRLKEMSEAIIVELQRLGIEDAAEMLK